MTLRPATADTLRNLPCQPHSGQPMDRSDCSEWLTLVPGWELQHDGSLNREFRFRGFLEALAFTQAVAWMAHTQDHHPSLRLEFNRCTVSFTTHSVRGLSPNDFICAARTDELTRTAHSESTS